MMDFDNKTVLISGANSFTGQGLLEFLFYKSNCKIVALSRKKSVIKIKSERIIYEFSNLVNREMTEAIIDKYRPDIIIHLAAITRVNEGEENPELCLKTNFMGTKYMADAFIKIKGEIMISFSSNLARMPKSIVGHSKLLSEIYLHCKSSSKTKLVSFRLPNLIDSPSSVMKIFEKQIYNNDAITITDTKMERRFIDRNEAIDYIFKIYRLSKKNETFIITKQNTRIYDLAKSMIEKSGKNIQIKIIGSKKGEKLIEEAYEPNEYADTQYKDLKILNKFESMVFLKNSIDELKTKDSSESYDDLLDKIFNNCYAEN